jgi:vacuolar-type H+-ATPase subunit E/Vma4
MKSELEIQQRRDALKLECQKISSQIDEVDEKLKQIPEGLNYEHLRRPLIKEKEGLHVSLGLMNSRWAETLWMLDE